MYKVIGVLFFVFLFLTTLAPQTAFAVDGEITYTGTNTNLTGDDVGAGPFGLGFTFQFYGTDYTQAWININGTVNFGGNYSRYDNQPLNTVLSGTNIADNSVYAFWDDLNTNASGQSGNRNIYYATVGTSPNRMFVSQWTNIYFHGTTVQMGTFQVILYEGTNVVQIQYRDLLGNSSQLNRERGNNATIGIRKNHTTFSQYSHNTASITQEQAIRYTPNGANSYTVDTSADYELVYLAPAGAPTSPTLVTPTNNTVGITTTPTFEWLPVESATSYRVLISTVSNFSTTVVDQTTSSVSYTHGSPLNTNTQYYWRVQSINSNGSSLSPTRTFTTAAVANTNPNTPSNVASSTLIGGNSTMNISGAELSATLSDDDVDEQIRYRIQIATDNSFNDLVIDYRSPFENEGNKTFTVGENGGTYLVGNSNTSLPPDDYYLRIRAEDDSAASSAWYTASGVAFSVAADSSEPTFSNIFATPTDNSVTITWNTNEAASSQIEYGLVPTYGDETAETNTSPRVTTHSFTINSLKPCARYFYVLKSTDGSSNRGISVQNSFATSGCEVSTIESGVEEEIATSGGTIELVNEGTTAIIAVPADFANEGARFQINLLDSTHTPLAPLDKNLVANNFFDLIAVTDSGTQLTSFDEPVTFTIEYGTDIESSYNENTLDIYKYLGGVWTAQNCSVDTIANTITCTLNGFSVYAVFGALVGGNVSNAVSTTNDPTQANSTCSNTMPVSAPHLYQIDATQDSATLFFAPPPGDITGYVIEYGTTVDANQHAVTHNHSDKSGAVSYTVNNLFPNLTWYFKVKAQNGCASGGWSEIKSTYLGTVPARLIDTNTTNNDIFMETSAPLQLVSISPIKVPKPSQTVQIPKKLKEYKVSVQLLHEGKPLADTEVILGTSNKKIKTDKNGMAIFSNIQEGIHKLKLINQSYAAEETIEVKSEDSNFDISLSVQMKKELLPTWAWFGIISGISVIFVIIIRKLRKDRKNRVV
jgi:hypothetical protein